MKADVLTIDMTRLIQKFSIAHSVSVVMEFGCSTNEVMYMQSCYSVLMTSI